MKRKTQQFVAAFVITLIVIGALCGFAVVDLSTERYLSSAFGPLFQVSSINTEGIRLAVLGRHYRIASDQFDSAREKIWQWRGLLPNSINLTANLLTRGYRVVWEYLEYQAPVEEPW